MRHRIHAVTVNHNTSAYAELMLRSLFAHHSAELNLSMTLYDNGSVDDTSGLRAYVESQKIPLRPSGFSTETANNSHGEVLRRFVLENSDCTHYLFLDTDVYFVADNTLGVMLAELDAQPDAFGIGPRQSWDGVNDIPTEVRAGNPDICDARLHPCCALVKNTSLFRRVVEEVGFSCAKYLWAEREEYLDTFKLMTKVMRTHGQRHIISSQLVMHFFSVSYIWEPTQHLNEQKAERRDALLAELLHYNT